MPKINLSQIEFNKIKVLNEADQYSLQKRNFQAQNIDENIKTMKKKIKKMKIRCEINNKKVQSFENYIKTVRDNLKALKKFKGQASVVQTIDIKQSDFDKIYF